MTFDTRPMRGPFLDLYGSADLAWRQIASTHPYALKVQGWANVQARVIAEARRRWPDVLLALCPGVDPVAKRWRKHRDHDRAVTELVNVARDAVSLGIGILVNDAERAYKSANIAERAALAAIASDATTEIRTRWPELQLGLTSFGWPVRVENVGGHGEFPWRGWLGGGVTFMGQTYDRGPGNLVEGERIAIASYRAAIEHGLMAPSTPRVVEVQTHHNRIDELVTVGTSTDATAWWAAGSEKLFDANGAKAWRAALALWRAGFWGGGAVQRFQASRGLKVDGDCGPMTLAALGL